MKVEQAVAEAWASLNGELEEFQRDMDSSAIGDGYYEGYMSDAKDLIKRIEKRGFRLVPLES